MLLGTYKRYFRAWMYYLLKPLLLHREVDLLSGKAVSQQNILLRIFDSEYARRQQLSNAKKMEYSSAEIWAGKSGDIFYSEPGHLYSESFLEEDSEYRRPLLDQIVAFSNGHSPKRIVEYGCGAGQCAYFLAKRADCSVKAYDPSEKAIQVAKSKYQLPNLEFLVGQYIPDHQSNGKLNTTPTADITLFIMVLMYFTPNQVERFFQNMSTTETLLCISEPLPPSNMRKPWGQVHSLSSFYHDIDGLALRHGLKTIFCKDINLGNLSGVGVRHRIYQKSPANTLASLSNR